MKHIKALLIIAVLGTLISCSKYLDVVPDNVATIENIFTLRSSAEKYLNTCYSYMPDNGHPNTNTAFSLAGEVWWPDPINSFNGTYWNIARGLQSVANPLGNWWTGTNYGKAMFDGIRDCNTFLANINKVPELNPYERERWIAEVKFLKAYYNFILFQRYGPIPLIKENMPISSSPEAIKVYRQPVDSVVNYIVQLLDESFANDLLPDRIVGNEGSELGRITKSIVIAFKARVLVTAASPLFNGNTEYANFTDKRGVHLFNSEYSSEKWQKAVDACKAAIDFCTVNGSYSLSTFAGNTGYKINDTIKRQLDIRTAITNKINNPEVIWANTNSPAKDVQTWSMPVLTTAGNASGSRPKGTVGPTINMAEYFYTKNGVPISEDKTWDYANRYALKVAGAADKFYIKTGQTTIQLHYDREPRFYADLGFDRGIWFGNWINNYIISTPGVPSALLYVMARNGEAAARQDATGFCITGYYCKKLINVESSGAADGNFVTGLVTYPYPEMRMAELYLLYSEALNELGGATPDPEAYVWINLVRARAGLPSVQDSWTNFSTNPDKYKTKEGLRDIIQQERTIELMFEGQRYWDLLRWKTAHIVLNTPIMGWDITQSTPQNFYRKVLLFNKNFMMRDYFWPIETKELQINSNLVQNPGW